ncbi:MAG: hypothetical protein R3336_05720, partial [Phycisphaeraceae bacterium]|nr:hypothetical protein [Phycisphaeraceae bacterium]
WLKEDGPIIGVYRGRYGDPSFPQARQDLRQTRLVMVDGERPFSQVRLVPITSETPGITGSMDLRQHGGLYSLQIAFFDHQYGPGYQKAAEAYARKLREEDGVEAFYYHGPHRSLVTVGIFDDHDFAREGAVHVYGARIRELQDKYPHNLANGHTLIERMGNEERTQESFVVRVP